MTTKKSNDNTSRQATSVLEVDQYYSGFAIEPLKPGHLEATLNHTDSGKLTLTYYDSRRGKGRWLVMKSSSDAGRTWGEPRMPTDGGGQQIDGNHQTVLRLKSGRMGLVYATTQVPEGRSGRDGGTMFRTSIDGGQTWSEPTVVERRFGICCSGHAIVTTSGRIVVPVFKWISHDPSGQSETFNAPSVSYSYAYVSDDEGQTWTQSLSELFISHYRAAYNLEEPTVIELSDGRLLMHLRAQVGRMYRSYSPDGGVSWSRPEGMPIAAGYTPCCLRRIPGSGAILMIWNQVSRKEIQCGYHRHRLSCAVSRDEGHTWQNFKNLESLDNLTVVTPPPDDWLEVLEQWEDYGYYQPGDIERYVRAPGVLRICYPDVRFVGSEAIIVYDYGSGTLGDGVMGIKLRAVPITWLTE